MSLTNWPRTLADSQWIERSETDSILSIIESEPYYNGVLLGKPGSGKSALLAHLAKSLENQGIPFLGIKADTLDVTVDSLGKLAERLHLPATITDCVKTITQEHKVVLLLDQLDALADLVDLRSDRLNVLLNLIHQLAGRPNLYIIASSREFEFNHDTRFQTIQAEVIQLELPSWESVNEVLKQLHIDGSKWPDSFKEILRTPQNLKIFVEHLNGTSEQKIFASYQEMLEELWYQKVTRSRESGPKKALLGAIAEEMSDNERLWLPIARFDDQRAILDHLVADGILKISENGFQFGFQHQTLFSHARARAVVQGDIDLCDFVIERQHALFVRPTLWSTLGYLREASREAYIIQMRRLCTEPLRVHIQHLLLDFLGRLEDPDEFEEVWLVKWLEDDSFQRRAITSISNSTGWFFRLKDSQIAILMQDPAGIEWQLVGLLSVMINRMPEETLALLKKIWLINSDRDAFTFHVFDQFTHWSEETVRTVCQIIDRTQINESFVTDIASKVSVQEPELAPKILATEFKKKLQAIQLLSEHRKKELPPEVTTEEEMSAFWMFASKTQFGELLESSSGRYGMDAIAEAAPLEFLKQMWPLFLEALEPTLDMPHHILNRFRTSSALHYQYRSEYSPEQPFLDAIRSALRELTSIDPSAFEIFVRNTFCIDAMLVQRMVCLSLVEQDAILVELSLDFLISDPRRLLIGDYQDSHRDSRNLIAKLAPKLSTEQLQQLEQSINNWTMYHSEIPDQTAEDKRDRMKWDRESRLRLLMAIPKHLLSEKAKSILGAEEVALPTVKARLERSETRDEMTQVISPMSTEQMKKANNAQILKLFDRLTDDTDWTHPRRGLRGGTVEASRALAELAKEYPERASELATQFRCSDQQIPVAHIVEALSVSDYPTERLFDLIRDLVKLGFNSQNFQETVASACALRGYQLDGLPDDICDLLKSWLDTWIFSIENNADDRELGESKEDKERSILFDQREWIEIPQGTYAIMSAIAFGLIRKIPPATDDWLTELNKHLERPEKLRTWQVFGRELRMLEYCDQAKAVRFLEELFVKYPKVRDSIQGVDLLGYLRNFIKEEAFITFIDQIAASEWSMGIQAKGELFGASYLVEDKFLSVDECIKFTVSSNVTADNRFLKGVAYSVAEFWKESRFQHKATELFEKLAERKSQEINQALGGVFLSDQFIPNKNSKRVLIATACHPGVIQVVNLYHFVELLELFTESEPELVLKLANILLDLIEYDSEDGNPRHIDLSDSVLTNIAITLQRRSDNFRGDGLDLFERLLRLGFSSTIQTMYELDNRPVNVIHHAQRRKRRKNRRRVD